MVEKSTGRKEEVAPKFATAVDAGVCHCRRGFLCSLFFSLIFHLFWGLSPLCQSWALSMPILWCCVQWMSELGTVDVDRRNDSYSMYFFFGYKYSMYLTIRWFQLTIYVNIINRAYVYMM